MPLPHVITRFSISSGIFSTCAATAPRRTSECPERLIPYWTMKSSGPFNSLAFAYSTLWRPLLVASKTVAPYFKHRRGMGLSSSFARLVPPYNILHRFPKASAAAAVIGACGLCMLQQLMTPLISSFTLSRSIMHCRIFPPLTSPGPNGS